MEKREKVLGKVARITRDYQVEEFKNNFAAVISVQHDSNRKCKLCSLKSQKMENKYNDKRTHTDTRIEHFSWKWRLS